MGANNSQNNYNHQPELLFNKYEKAMNNICLNNKWLRHTRLSRYLKATKLIFDTDPSLYKELSSQLYFENNLLILIRRGYNLKKDDEARRQTDILCGINIFDSLKSLYDFLDITRKPFLCYAIKQLNTFESLDVIIGKLSEACDRASRCASAKKQGFCVLFLFCFQYHEKNKQSRNSIIDNDLNGLKGAKEHLNACFEDYLDEYKERAFNTSFIQPARYYYDCIGDHVDGRDHVNIHGINWYLYLLEITIDVQLPLLPLIEDDCNLGLCSFWSGLNNNIWEIFCSPNNFGRDFECIPELKSCNVRSSVHKINNHNDPLREARYPKSLEDIILRKRNEISIYVERYAYFFSKEVFVKKAFEGLNSEFKPEYVGFRKACDTLYIEFRQRNTNINNELPESIVDFLYDEFYMNLNIERVYEFLSFVALVKPINNNNIDNSNNNSNNNNNKSNISKQSSKTIDEEKDNSYTLTKSYVCKSCCFLNYDNIVCIVCDGTELISEEEFFDSDIVNELILVWSSANGNTPPNVLAGIYGIWQILEIQCVLNQDLVFVLAKRIVNDNNFKNHLKNGVMNNSTWLRDSSGIIFRLWSLVYDCEIKFCEDIIELLHKSIEIILNPFELSQPIYLGHGHYYGGLYMQILTPLLDAKNSGFLVNNLSLMARRVANAIKHSYENYKSPKLLQEIKENMYEEYIISTQIIIWGNQENDIIWTLFYKT